MRIIRGSAFQDGIERTVQLPHRLRLVGLKLFYVGTVQDGGIAHG